MRCLGLRLQPIFLGTQFNPWQMGKHLTQTSLSQHGLPKKQKLWQDLWASWLRYQKGIKCVFQEVIPVSRVRDEELDRGGRDNIRVCYWDFHCGHKGLDSTWTSREVYRTPPRIMCWKDERQEHLRKSSPSLFEQMSTPRDVDSLTLTSQWTWTKWAPRGNASIKGAPGQKATIHVWACPELSTPVTAKAEVRLSRREPGHRFFPLGTWNWD